MTPLTDDERRVRRRDRQVQQAAEAANQFWKELLKVAIAIAFAWFAVRERVSVMESEIANLKEHIVRLDNRINAISDRHVTASSSSKGTSYVFYPPINR